MTALLAVKFIAIVTSICAALFTSGLAQVNSIIPQRNDIINTCSKIQFRCRNGDCIGDELLCDGRADCSDQSDETEIECTKPEYTCPDYAFRCTYGACVNGDATCDGVKDCVDNSDETLAKCPGISGAVADEACGPEDYRCQNGQCISSTSLCDGTVECTDGSDETLTKCGSFSCIELVFRCNYGACIDGDLTCNNVIDCADGSDEDPLLCGHPGPRPTTAKPPTPTPTPTPKPTPTTGPITPVTSNCVAPPQPENGFWKLYSKLCPGFDGGTVDCDIAQGTALPPGYKLIYRCHHGYKLRGSTEVHCVHGGTLSLLPVCIEIRCGPLNSPAVKATCSTQSGEHISCNSTVPPGTHAKVRCQPGYRKDTNYITSRRSGVTCNSDGKWDPTPVMCIPACGISNTHATPFIINGTTAKLGDFPWHATLYREETTNARVQKEFQCGATIIRTNLVMTAAHCIYDEESETTVAPRKLWIMTGNILRDFESQAYNNRTVKHSRVKNVYRNCQYYGLLGNYASDIALLELETPFVLSEILLPACLDVNDDNAQILEAGAFGMVAGFGRTATGPTSGILQTITVPYVSYTECRRSLNIPSNRAFITDEKFCAGYNGSAVCFGDSGGGLVFESNGLWYVMGIVSVGLGTNFTNNERTCDTYSYTVYTKVSSYLSWIQEIILNLKNSRMSTEC